VISHPALDIHPGQAGAQRRYNERVATPAAGGVAAYGAVGRKP